jgi:hypothetical protein
MTPEKVQQWLTPVKKPMGKPVESSLAMLDKLAELQVRPRPSAPVVETIEEETEELGSL